MKQYVLAVEAQQDLEDIWKYIAEDNVAAADSWIGRLHQAFASTAKSPGIGHTRPDLTSAGVLFWSVGAYVIVYRERADMLQVVAVTQGSRHIPTLLSRRGL